MNPRLVLDLCLAGLGRRAALRLAGAGLLGALADASGIALMATATWLLMTAAGQPPLAALTIAIVSVRALAIGRGGLRYLERLAGHDAVLRIVADVRARIFARLIDRPLARHGDALSRMVSDVEAVQDLVIRVALPLFAAGVAGVLATVAAFTIDPLVGATLAAGLAVSGLVLPGLGVRLVRHGAARLAPLRAAHAVATVDVVHGAADLAAYGATGRYEGVAAARARELSDVERSLAWRSHSLDLAASVVSGLTAAAVLFVAAQREVAPVWVAVAAIGALAVGELALGALTAARKGAEISGSLTRVGDLIAPPGNVSPGRAGSGPRAAWQAPDGAARERAGAWRSSGDAAPERAGAWRSSGDAARDRAVDGRSAGGGLGLRLEGVGVTGRLTGIDLDLPPGRKIAVVGPSGAGKSTLLAVLAGAIEPDTGRVIRHGRGTATGLMADAHLFHTTIRENLRLATPRASDEQLVAAGAVAGIDLSRRYPLEVLVGEDGARLSGGERQRLALTRAVLAEPDVLLLDEPTEGLDPAHADAVLRQVIDHAGERSVVLVTHRLASLDRIGLDEVLIIDSGRIIERGAPARLPSTEGWMRTHPV